MQNKAYLPGVEINAISLFTKDYENFMLHESQKNKANRRSLAGNPKHESRNPKRVERAIWKNKPNFWKGEMTLN